VWLQASESVLGSHHVGVTNVEYHRVGVIYNYSTPTKVAAVVCSGWSAVHKALWPGSLALFLLDGSSACVVRGPCDSGPCGQELYVVGGRLLACRCPGSRSAKMRREIRRSCWRVVPVRQPNAAMPQHTRRIIHFLYHHLSSLLCRGVMWGHPHVFIFSTQSSVSHHSSPSSVQTPICTLILTTAA
jgi:hypothetical protein